MKKASSEPGGMTRKPSTSTGSHTLPASVMLNVENADAPGASVTSSGVVEASAAAVAPICVPLPSPTNSSVGKPSSVQPASLVFVKRIATVGVPAAGFGGRSETAELSVVHGPAKGGGVTVWVGVDVAVVSVGVVGGGVGFEPPPRSAKNHTSNAMIASPTSTASTMKGILYGFSCGGGAS